ncbi:hypothetical protein KAFR_0B06810 [Kazachstania africana CBS 2517]|uniref:C2H2-type domain-containing protein n=1 Tax=Kazachstania africana (strain ATCC 22294 / BCRC 22015 / CBS 2517 / CECT 1963 / NBRC 1671 / NRRL Y-8276) TaxID=1071382 RepID=H2ARH8_KAZAF|nr:hypothetical protein KAFR_0B06810 [Kazachstania africana CBS 2517]CCF56978.1 hypothetical protein KAFR_0B06810 [Kazachstania africana CBS 2517]
MFSPPGYVPKDLENNNVSALPTPTNSNNVTPSAANLLPIPKKSRIIKTDKPRPFLCSICTRGFVRQEHLKRHQRAHTSEKPFLCTFCGRCFARRDLVLRHQHKLHSSLISKSNNDNTFEKLMENNKNLDLNGAMPSTIRKRNTDPDKHIIKVDGNKKTILPTLTNPLAQTAAQMKKAARDAAKLAEREANNKKLKNNKNVVTKIETKDKNDLTSQNYDHEPILKQRNKRHASFSASTAFTYVPTNNQPVIEQDSDFPHQVGFSTPQLTAQKLIEKAAESGVDLNSIDVPTFLSLDDQSNLQSIDIQHNIPNSHHNQTNQIDWKNPYYDNVPFLTDFLTMGSSFGGSGGFANFHPSNSTLDLFNFQSISPTKSDITTTATATKQAINDHSFSGSASISQALNHPTKIKSSLDKPSSILDLSASHLENLTNDLGLDMDKQWFNKFLSKSENQPNTTSSTANTIDFEHFAQNILPTPSPNENSGSNFYSSSSSSFNNKGATQFSLNNEFNFNSIDCNIPDLFTSRQFDLFKENNDFLKPDSILPNPSSSFPPRLSQESLNDNEELSPFNSSIRDWIISSNNLTSDVFPTVEELNRHVNLYKENFHKIFPFIHIQTLKITKDNYPLLLSIATIGAFYAFKSKHAAILSSITLVHVKKILEKQKDNYENTPLWVIQTIVLLTINNTFNNDVRATKNVQAHLMTLVQLIKVTKINLPLENFVTPPIESDHFMEFQDNPQILKQLNDRYKTSEQVEKNFQYFILAQSRIRTCHTVLLITNFFSSLVGLDCNFHSVDLKCGVSCYNEILFHIGKPQIWANRLSELGINLDSKFSLIELSKGNGNFEDGLAYLSTGSQYFFENSKLSFRTLLSYLITVHEKISIERHANNQQTEYGGQVKEAKWRMNSRPIISSVMKHWEALYIKNGGILKQNDENIKTIISNPSIKLIIPLYLFAKIRKCVNLSDLMNKIWLQDWDGMNKGLKKFYHDWESLHEATEYSLEIIEFWHDMISNSDSFGIVTIPILSVTCILSSILIIFEYLKILEEWTERYKKGKINAALNVSDRILWLKIVKVLKKIETQFISNSSYHITSSESDLIDDERAMEALKPETDIAETVAVINTIKLSQRSLFLGIGILSATPVWTVSSLFAQALQSGARYGQSHQ